MDEKLDESSQADSGNSPDKPAKNSRRKLWRRFVHYAMRKAHQNKAKREEERAKEKPEEKAARKTATATAWIAAFTVVLAVVGSLTLYEVILGGGDTKSLIKAAQQQSLAAQQFAKTAKLIDNGVNNAVAQLGSQAEASEESNAALVGANRAWMVPISFSQTVAPIVVTFNNAGKSPAINLVGRAEYATQIVVEETASTPSHLADGCGHLQSIRWKMMQPMVAAGRNLDFTLGDLPAVWNKPLATWGYKALIIHGCLWYQDALTNQQRWTEFWLRADNFRFRNAPYNENEADTAVDIHNGKIFYFIRWLQDGATITRQIRELPAARTSDGGVSGCATIENLCKQESSDCRR